MENAVETAATTKGFSMRKRLRLRLRAAGLTTSAGLLACLALGAGVAFAVVSGAVSSSDNPGYTQITGTTYGTDTDGTTTSTTPLSYTDLACINGKSHTDPANNCNIYNAKPDVWLSGLPGPASIPQGTYFFAVLDPGGQRDANDGSAGNLSVDPYTARTFSVADDGTITNFGTHAYDASPRNDASGPKNVLQVWPFADTDNQGGVYILAVCRIDQLSSFDDQTDPQHPTYDASKTPVGADNCKYDAFKVLKSPLNCDPNSDPNCPPPPPPADDLTVSKTATPSFTRKVTWGIKKTATPSSFTGNGGTTKSVNYEIDVSHHTTDSGWQVQGTITIHNPNSFDVTDVTLTENNAACKLDSSTTSTPNYNSSSLSDLTVAATGSTAVKYLCTYSGTTPDSNTATATWPASFGTPTTTATSNTASWLSTDYSAVLVNGCVNVTDDDFSTTGPPAHLIATLCLGTDGNPLHATGYSPDGVLTSALASSVTATHVAAVSGPPPADAYFKLTYSKTLTILASQCSNFVNTATFTGSDDGTVSMHGSTQATVTLCPKVNGLTIGFWQNKNGQALINGGTPTGTCTALHNYLVQFNPFKDIDSNVKYGTLCGTSAGYTQTKSTGSTGLAGYVYDIVKAANASGASMNAMLKAQMLGTALSAYFSTTGLWQINIDLTKICNMIDNTTSGSATCGSGGFLTGVGAAFTTNGTLPPGNDVKFTSLIPSDPLASGGCTTTTAPTAMIVECLLWNAASWSNAGGSSWYAQNNKTTQGLAKNTFDAINNSAAVAAGP
jgi:hypothetical protein